MKQTSYQHGKGGAGGHRSKREWVRAAQQAILSVLDEQLAAPRVELDRRLHELGVQMAVGEEPTHFDPHIIGEALNQLVELHAIGQTSHVTKGPRTVPLNTTGRVDHRQHGSPRRYATRRCCTPDSSV